jgi:eukaryotic-like serine/threonine-protein kinase
MQPFVLESVLGGGAYATVVTALLPSGERRALKVLHEDRCGDPIAVGRFQDEGRILERLNHPTIVRGYGTHRFGDRLVLELELVEGATLERILGPAPHRLELSDAVAIAQQVAEGLWSAWTSTHGAEPLRIVHRDVQPGNILLDRGGAVKILDFGIAKGSFDDREALSLHDVGGALGYLAPERKDGHVGPAIDVYSLGVFVVQSQGHRMLLPQLNPRHDEVALERLSTFGLPEPLRALLFEMVRFDPQARPAMNEVVERLASIAATLPPSDLKKLAREVVMPHLKNPMSIDPRKHRLYPDVSFLETMSAATDEAPPTVTEVRRQVQALLATGDWVRHAARIRRVLRSSPTPVETPLLDVLDRATVPWWRPFTKCSTPEEIEAALLILADRGSPATLERAKSLQSHQNPRVAKVARFVCRR